jgi:hypothetical protein
MNILFAPMAVSLPARGPLSQFLSFLEAARARGHEVAACAARDAVWRDPPGVRTCPAPAPRLLGWIPAWSIAPIVRPLFLRGEAGARRTRMTSFEEVQARLGLASPGYFFEDMEAVTTAIAQCRPDVVVAGRFSALLAARRAGIPVVVFLDRPQTSAFASSPRLTRRLRARLVAGGLGDYASILDVAREADLLIVPGLKALSDLGDMRAEYVGPLTAPRAPAAVGSSARDTILCYPGVSSIDPDGFASLLASRWKRPGTRIVIVRPGREERRGIVELVERYQEEELFPRLLAMIHHGGQNSCWACLREGIPQLVIAGGHFEREANARMIEAAGAGLAWRPGQGEPALVDALERIIADPSFSSKAADMGRELARAGGLPRALELIEGLVTLRRRTR